MVEVEARTVLWIMVFIGFAVNYMIRINLNITIVEMVVTKSKPQPKDETLIEWMNSSDIQNASGIFSNNTSSTNKSSIYGDCNEKTSLERLFLDHIDINYECSGFHWNEQQQGLVLGSFFFLHWITQIPGGILAKKFGTKLIFGLSNAIGCWLCFLIPIVSYWDYRALIWLRILQGLITGLAWPAMHVLTAKWIPPNERSKFVTSYLGSSVGIGIFYPLFGCVMHWSSWEWVYHICGIIGTLWWLGWLIFVYDAPNIHPRISQIELRYIEKCLGASVQNEKQGPTPWKAIMTSRPVWMNVIAQWGGIWGLFTVLTQAPTYFRVVHNWNIRATGLLSGLPHIMRMIFAFLFSIMADYLLQKNKMSRTNLRKLATAVCCILKGIMVLALAYFGYNPTAAIVLLTIATMFHGAVSSGPLASIIDIAPNYAGIVLGLSGMIGVLPGFISPYIVGVLTLGNQTFDAWKNVFLICAGMLIACGVLYVCFADSTLQGWNTIQLSDDLEKDMQMLNEESLQHSKSKTENDEIPLKKDIS